VRSVESCASGCAAVRCRKTPAVNKDRCTFGLFELDMETGELRRAGRPVHLAPQPSRVLVALVERAGQTVSRDELKEVVWGDNTFVDFEQGLNFCIKQIRSALGDEAENPRFIETVPRRGYRVIAPVARLKPEAREEVPVASGLSGTPVAPGLGRIFRAVIATAVIVAAIGAYYIWSHSSHVAADPGKVMIAVLPFKNLSADADQQYFSDGFTDELITQLSRTDPAHLGVIARTSILSYRDTTRSVADIGRELGVKHVVEGTIRKGGDRVRINAQLIRVSDQSHLWADVYEGDVRDILRVQREVGDAVARQILTALSAATGSSPKPIDPAVYELYLRARFAWNTRQGPEIEKATELFREAVRRDPEFARAWAGLADTLLIYARPEALEAAERAIALDDHLAEAHAAKAEVLKHMLRWDWADQEFRRAIALDPSYVPGHYFYAEYLVARGRRAQAIAEARQALALDPKSAIAAHVVGVTQYYSGAYAEALPYFRKALELDPHHLWTHHRIGLVFERQGAYDRAFAEFTAAGAELRTAYAYAKAGNLSRARQIVKEALTKPDVDYQAYHLAGAYVGLGEYDEALKYLERAVARQLHDVIFLNVDPRFEPLHSHPKYRELLRQGGWE
jgi:TolB-like protein/DNA-binding winged helix-turn-helix (wHTH) protein/Tfp pilus assembly protein PilF